MARNRVDDEEALIPRADTEEYHKTANRKKRARCCSTCCSVKCWFITFFLLVISSTVLFYFVYPTVIHDNFNKFMGLACGAFTDPAEETVTCVIKTSPESMATQAHAVRRTWASRCTDTYFIYKPVTDQDVPAETKQLLPNLYSVDDTDSVMALSYAFNESGQSSWYLMADDTTFVPYDRIQRLMRTQSSINFTYLGSKLDAQKTSLQPYAMNKMLMDALMSRKDSEKSQVTLLKTVLDSANITTYWTGFSMGNPLKEPNNDKVLNMTLTAYAFTDVSPQEMYAYYVISNM